jgi:hypothetical protein
MAGLDHFTHLAPFCDRAISFTAVHSPVVLPPFSDDACDRNVMVDALHHVCKIAGSA